MSKKKRAIHFLFELPASVQGGVEYQILEVGEAEVKDRMPELLLNFSSSTENISFESSMSATVASCLSLTPQIGIDLIIKGVFQ